MNVEFLICLLVAILIAVLYRWNIERKWTTITTSMSAHFPAGSHIVIDDPVLADKPQLYRVVSSKGVTLTVKKVT